MRLFIAVDLPESLRSLLRPLTEGMWRGAKAVPLEQLHLTLRFLGELPEPDLPQWRDCLSALSSDPFSLSLSGVGVFPNPQRARILWVGLQSGPELFALQNQVEAAAQGLGLPPETKPFSPHLTLARLKFPAPREVAAYLQRHANFASPAFEVGEFHLYSSLLSPKGAEHRKEATFKLSTKP